MTVAKKTLLALCLLVAAGLLLGRAVPWKDLGQPWVSGDGGGLVSPAWASHSNGRANAGPDQTVAVGETVILDGSGTLSLAGAEVQFFWSLTSVPAGSLAALDDANAIQPSFVADLPGDYVAELTVNAGGPHNSQASQVTISTTNSAPVADPGRDSTVSLGGTVVLDGSRSHDVDGDALTYAWSLVQVPAGSGAILDDPSAVKPSFFVDTDGTYVAALTVNDGTADSAQAQVTLDTTNSPAVAQAGPHRMAGVGQTVTLDAGRSFDPDGDEILAAVRWDLLARPAGSGATLSSGTAVRTSLTPDVAGTYLVQLEAAANSGQEGFDTLVVTAGNVPPTAEAGPDQSVAPGSEVTLDGGGSTDLNGDRIGYSWSLLAAPAGSAATLDDPSLPRPSFTADLSGTYVAQLVVDDGARRSRPDTVVVDTANSRPVAEAGPEPAYVKGTTLPLDATGSGDADSDPLTYQWSVLKQESGKQGAASISDPASPTPTFSAGRDGLYVLQLQVDDGSEPGAPDTLVISTDNARPAADAGGDLTLFASGVIQLNGGGSSDGDSDSLSYAWALIAKPAGSAAVLSSTTALNPTFATDLTGFYVAQLVVSDGALDSAPDTVVVHFDNNPPVADAGLNQTVTAGTTVQLDGTGSSDPDMDPLTYAWQAVQVPPGSAAILSDPASATPSFPANAPGTYVLQLIVNDGVEDSLPDTVTITANPVATPNLPPVLDPVGNQSVDLGTSLTLDLSAGDPNGLRGHDTHFGAPGAGELLGLRPGLRGLRRRPSLASRVSRKRSAPSGRPVRAWRRRASSSSSSRPPARKSAQSPTASSSGATCTRPSSRPARWARALDHGQSRARRVSLARTGLSST
ncbi:MAG: PKD domain-containing protein [Rhodospirillales bacterium]|nr:PKD domain-containing protein [Rhodospirillales bacterium]